MKRYPGTRAFNASNNNIFWGRDMEIKKLTDYILLENVITLTGRSGAGKTSLLNAGILPVLNKYDNTKVYNFTIPRFSDIHKTLVTKLKEKLNVNKEANILNKIIAEDNGLWRQVKDIQLSNLEINKIIFVFDQFENLFSHSQNQQKEFLEELSIALNTKIPQNYRDIMNERLNNNILSEEEVKNIYNKLEVKILISISSEKISELNNIKKYLPDVLRNIFEINPLKKSQATLAITEPAFVEDAGFDSPTFTYDEDALVEIIKDLTLGREFIEPTQLQIVCTYFEDIIISQKITNIKLEHTQEIKDLYKKFYRNCLTKIDVSEQSNVKHLIEEVLIYDDNNEFFRTFAYEAEIISKYKIKHETLLKLVELNLINSFANENNKILYEISSDTLVKPILELKKERKEAELVEKIKEEERQKNEKIKEEEKQKNKKLKSNYLNIILLLTFIALIFFVISLYLENKKQQVKMQKQDVSEGTNFQTNVLNFESYQIMDLEDFLVLNLNTNKLDSFLIEYKKYSEDKFKSQNYDSAVYSLQSIVDIYQITKKDSVLLSLNYSELAKYYLYYENLERYSLNLRLSKKYNYLNGDFKLNVLPAAFFSLPIHKKKLNE